jgi:hypothetical protein
MILGCDEKKIIEKILNRVEQMLDFVEYWGTGRTREENDIEYR